MDNNVKLFNYLRYNSNADLDEICNNKDKYTFIKKYNIYSTFELLGKCIILYEQNGIESFRLKLMNHFYDIENKCDIFYFLSEKISMIFPNFFEDFEDMVHFCEENVNISTNLLANFLRNQNYESLKCIPYISNKYEKILKKNNIYNTYILLGKYLELKSNPDKMISFLKSIGIHNNIHNIVYCIKEKCDILIPNNNIEVELE